MKIPTRRPSNRGISIIECLVYGFVLLILLGITYSAFYRCVENSYALRRSAEDTAAALRAGERWRADIRSATGSIQSEATPDGAFLHLQSPHGAVDYHFTSNAVLRRAQSGPWAPLLASVKASAMQADPRGDVAAWRWELELRPRSKKPVRMTPLFTFIAVPERSSTP
jgi:Tfp pilus assembly protein PilE